MIPGFLLTRNILVPKIETLPYWIKHGNPYQNDVVSIDDSKDINLALSFTIDFVMKYPRRVGLD